MSSSTQALFGASALRMARPSAARQMRAVRPLLEMQGSRMAFSSLQRCAVRGQRLSAPASPQAWSARYMHCSRPARSAGESDAELSDRLKQEISYEKEAAAEDASENDGKAEPDFLSTFRAQGIWKIEDTKGSDEISLTREFGNETIRVMFSIGDIDTAESDEVEEDEELEGKGEEGDDEGSSPFPVRCAITISKANQGALAIEAAAMDGAFSIDNISFYKDAKLGTDLTPEADWARRGLYVGPQFETLDEGVQTQFESFLEERGIATDLAVFIPTFAEYKEQREYCGWLENVKAFVDA